VTAYDDGTVLIYDTLEAKVKTKIYCRKYGMGNVRFTHHPSAIIGSSTRCNFDFSIRYLSLHDYTYIREFRGHNDSVVSIAVSPSDDTFVSGAMDSSVRFWDLKSSTCIAVLKKQGHHVVAYDPTGVAFCCASPNNLIKLFDLRGLSKGPFSTFKLAHEPVDFLDIQFSDDGKCLLITTDTNSCFLLDAYDGRLVQKYIIKNECQAKIGSGFTPDSQYVVIANESGKINVWPVGKAEVMTTYEGHTSPIGCIQWNPKYKQFASACSNTALWLPRLPAE